MWFVADNLILWIILFTAFHYSFDYMIHVDMVHGVLCLVVNDDLWGDVVPRGNLVHGTICSTG